jgi:DeoR family deoxyribose operon repressor
LRLLGGHITRVGSEASDYRVADQDTRHVEEKRRIGKLAARLIQPGDTVFFDCGTTSPFVIDFIPDELEFTAVCSSLNVLLRLQNKPNCHIVLCGGTFHRKNQVFESSAESSILDSVRLTWAFVRRAIAGLTQQPLPLLRIQVAGGHAERSAGPGCQLTHVPFGFLGVIAFGLAG